MKNQHCSPAPAVPILIQAPPPSPRSGIARPFSRERGLNIFFKAKKYKLSIETFSHTTGSHGGAPQRSARGSGGPLGHLLHIAQPERPILGVRPFPHCALLFLTFSVLLFTALLNQNEPWMRFPAYGLKKDPAALHQYRSLEPEPSTTYI